MPAHVQGVSGDQPLQPCTFLSWGVFRSVEKAIASRGQVRPVRPCSAFSAGSRFSAADFVSKFERSRIFESKICVRDRFSRRVFFLTHCAGNWFADHNE